LLNVEGSITAQRLFIHPFREGNGRTARLLADLMAQWYGFRPFQFDRIKPDRMEEYIIGVQSAADQNYTPMIELFNTLR
jgi:cell filamentation protein